jgi:hypothetical protein
VYTISTAAAPRATRLLPRGLDTEMEGASKGEEVSRMSVYTPRTPALLQTAPRGWQTHRRRSPCTEIRNGERLRHRTG